MCLVSHDIQRIGYHDDDCVWRMLDDIFCHRLNDAGVGFDQVIAGHAWLSWEARGDHNYVRVGSFAIIVGAAHGTAVVLVDGGFLPDVKRFAFGNAFLDVY